MARRTRRRGGRPGRLVDAMWDPMELGFAAWRRAQRPIERPDIREALDPEVLDVLREDAERLQEFTGRRFDDWSLWSD